MSIMLSAPAAPAHGHHQPPAAIAIPGCDGKEYVLDPDAVALCGKLRNTTMTATASIAEDPHLLSINLTMTFEQMPLVDADAGESGPISVKGLSGAPPRGRPSTPAPAVKKPGGNFSNSLTIEFVLCGDVRASKCNLKLFSNGSVQGTGLKNPAQFVVVVDILRRILEARPHLFDGQLRRAPYGAKVAMLNCNTPLPFTISLGRFVHRLETRNVPFVHTPPHPSVKVYEVDPLTKQPVSNASVSPRVIGITGPANPEHALRHAEDIVRIVEEDAEHIDAVRAFAATLTPESATADSDAFAAYLAEGA